ncbi:conserved protein of unknown function [Methylacidimicrobium sp. AP8]|uniref:type III-B CRISPR module-associated protein Cmr5 n=1 Tax=Methylacidimicrobium sp. AP8 TaxID=2730359 RepID=UPI0018C03CB8|nr:type III-B CRISPR module-associated protein Cmr5 [Methylacidimicrobium sp. AP8]CAB4243090.1 conserved protein of unknown function [Methylacidimicrobium sp. AP8]
MENLEQQRARHALEKGKKLKRQDVNRLPALIIGNGLLATAAFARSRDRKGGLTVAMDAIADHLAARGLIRKPDSDRRAPNTEDMLQELSNADSLRLRLATEEALAYLVYLKRFASPEE